MQSFLSRLNEYEHKEENEEEESDNDDNNKNEYKDKSRNNNTNNKNNNKKVNIGRFRSIGGMRVVVGKYIGLDDQGKCILPWDWSL
jgi:hypothetical protein